MMIAARIQDILAEGMSNKEFAIRLGVSPSVVSRFLSGRNNFTIDKLSEFEVLLGEKILISPKTQKKALVFEYKTNPQPLVPAEPESQYLQTVDRARLITAVA